MKKLTYIIVILLAVILAMGCTNLFNPDDGSDDSDNTGDDGTTTNTVYAAGFYEDSSQSVASYWVHVEDGSDPSKQDLYSQANAEVLDVHVVNGVVYTAGFYVNSAGNSVACYWIDGQRTDLYNDSTTDGDDARATGIFFDGTDVYVSGYLNAGSEARAVYWKNNSGGQIALHSDLISQARDIYVYNNNVYVSGYTGLQVACYWINGASNRSDLPYAGYSIANAIFVDESDGTVYTAGLDFTIENGNEACYWENSLKVSLSNVDSTANDIYVAGGNVYIAGGYVHNAPVKAACYWLNNSAGMVELYKGSNTAEAYGIQVQDGDVYISGFINNGTYNTAGYWENDTFVTLYDSSRSIAYAIAIQSQ
ncbi:MAG: hypothetical protein K9L66_12405 [Spirochaetaceae bacterium]|nr:hypothetical protein [Spirochaetaceae bacterium]